MAGKKKRGGKSATTFVSDRELIRRLEKHEPDVLKASIPEALFDTAVTDLLTGNPLTDDVAHFYCRKCGEYHLKTHPHYS